MLGSLTDLLAGPLQLATDSPRESVRTLAAEIAGQLLQSTGLFEHDPLEAYAYITAWARLADANERAAALSCLQQAITRAVSAPYALTDTIIDTSQRSLPRTRSMLGLSALPEEQAEA